MPRKPRDQYQVDLTTPVEPLRASQCQAIIEGLESGALDHRGIHERIIHSVRGGKLWSTKEWKELRTQLIKPACEQCGETEGPMNLQHLWHPETVTDVEVLIRSRHKTEYFNAFVAEFAGHPQFRDRVVPDGPPRPGCPKCGGWVLRERKTAGLQRFRCESQRRRRHCHFEFDEAVELQPISIESGAYHLHRAFAEAYKPESKEITEAVQREAAIQAVISHEHDPAVRTSMIHV